MREHPARDARTAHSKRRQTWYGDGRVTSAETDAFGRWVNDLVAVFADVSLSALPVLYYFLLSEDLRFFGVKTMAFVAWAGATVVATAIRGGWFEPPGTDVLGWVSVTPALVALRVVYFNATLWLAAYGGTRTLVATDSALVGVAFALAVAVAATLAFPRVAEECYELVSG
ncbi:MULTISPECIES: hypothetical protein [Halorussus]|uniref:hypothetical protein n=1 Tax=Halorussus TaxID=1070314 RepID=UPI00209FB6CB|nr:hypothetical protein [Halorussus vallis]USZ75233.1 hypothetical protein NGM07_17590 [Halorussus vallis]